MDINNSIDNVINCSLSFFKNHMDIDKRQESILTYGIRLVINSIIAFTLAFIPALIFGTFRYVLIITISFAALRVFSGGAHNSSIQNCSLNGAIISNILGLISKYLTLNKEIMFTLILVTFFFSLWAIGKFAPADTPSKPITTKAKKQVLRRNSFLVLSLWTLLSLVWFMNFSQVNAYIYASTVGILWQSFTLTKSGYRLYDNLDYILIRVSNFFKKGDNHG